MGRLMRRSVRAILCVAALVTNSSPARVGAAVLPPVAPTPAFITLRQQTPTLVSTHQAALIGAVSPAQVMAINMVLPLRNQNQLDQFLASQNSTGQVMSRAEIADLFLPTQTQVDAVTGWAGTHALRLAAVSGNRTLVTLRGTAAAIDAALSVHINTYRTSAGRRFFSNDRDATIPSDLGVLAIDGLNSVHQFHTNLRFGGTVLRTALRRAIHSSSTLSPPYGPYDFRTAYNVTHDGSGQTIGFTLWGTSVAQTDLNQFAVDTGDSPIIANQAGANGIDWNFPTPQYSPGFYASDVLDETAMDVEYAHATAPNAHLDYFLGDQYTTIDNGCGCYDPTDVGLENAIAAAASPSDPNLHVVSNSWGGGELSSLSDPWQTSTQQSFQLAKAAGITFYFSTGDQGSDSGGGTLPQYPADSPYVVAVGGTSLTLNGDSTYNSETAWSGSGGGCSTVSFNARPSWQTFVVGPNVAPSCAGRAEPDVSADADPSTGAYVDYNGGSYQIGGTSLATPLWAGMTAAADSYEVANGHSVLPFTGPIIYGCANNQPPYPANCRNAYQDVVSGNDGAFSAGSGWDQVTGWGSINWTTWVQDVTAAVSPPTATSTSTMVPPVGSLVGSSALPQSNTNLT
ncbi:MAG TPA: S53 family peptidase, partial [Chloroflexota bacterium]|nr:S53 family peptidase [Chloroflexota bacterium]